MSLIDEKSLFRDELGEIFKQDGYPNYRVNQVYLWLTKGVESFDAMLNIPKELRCKLSEKFYIAKAEIKRKGQVEKPVLLFFNDLP